MLEYVFAKPNYMKWYGEWFNPFPVITAILPWFCVHHSWSKTTPTAYLEGARIIFKCPKLVNKIVDKYARDLIEEVITWNTGASNDMEKSFVERLHLEVAVPKLGLKSSTETMEAAVPCPFMGDDASKLLKAVGHHARNKSSTGAVGALMNAAKAAA